MYSFGYEDSDKDLNVKIYDLGFKVNKFTVKELKQYEKLDNNDYDKLEEVLEKLLGNGAIEKINDKRKKDGYGEMTIDVLVKVITFVIETVAKQIANDDEIRTDNYYKNDRYNRRNRYNRSYGRNYRRY